MLLGKAGGPDPRPGWYYVTAICATDPLRSARVAGPYDTHAAALAAVTAASDRYISEAIGLDPGAAWHAYGTSRMEIATDGSAAPSAYYTPAQIEAWRMAQGAAGGGCGCAWCLLLPAGSPQRHGGA